MQLIEMVYVVERWQSMYLKMRGKLDLRGQHLGMGYKTR